MKIYIITDIEGVAGVLDYENWCVRNGIFYNHGQALLTREVNAAVKGLYAGGVSAITVLDGHGEGGIDPALLDPRVDLIRGPGMEYPPGLDNTYDGICWIGQHAKAGTPFSHLTHTQSFSYIDVSLNGISIGEFGQVALCAMELGVPSFFASGEKALCEEAESLTPGILTVSVKEGLLPDGMENLSAAQYARAKLGARHLSPESARLKMSEGAQQAAQDLKNDPGRFSYPHISPPYEMRYFFRRDEEHAERWEIKRTHPSSIQALIYSYFNE